MYLVEVVLEEVAVVVVFMLSVCNTSTELSVDHGIVRLLSRKMKR